MCGQTNCRGRSRCARAMSRQSTGCGCNCGCDCGCSCGCECETSVPTATISMADYEPFILVPTSVFDQGDVDCGCSCW